MPERIYKLQPDRTISLRGFDGLGAAAAVHSATPDSFKVTGVFRDPADFAVLILYDADNFYEHPSIRYLPDFDFSGLTLTFDLHYSNLMPLESPKYPTIDWPYLDAIRTDGTTARIRLSSYAANVGGTSTSAWGQFTVQGSGLKEYDRLTLWYLNFAFDYIVPKVECGYLFRAAGGGTVHSVTVAGSVYRYNEQRGDTDAAVAGGVVAALAACPEVIAYAGDDTVENGPFNQVNLRSRKSDGAAFDVGSSASPNAFTMYGVTVATVAAALAAQVNSVNWETTNTLYPLIATADGPVITIASARQGVGGNMLRMYAVWKNDRLRTDVSDVVFAGGTADVTWRISLDFETLGIPQIRQMWLTFAPALADGAPYTPSDWEASFTNWTLSGPDAKRALQIAVPPSVRLEESNSACKFSGNWTLESGFFSEGEARRTSTAGDSVTIKYTCLAVHDLYVGTSLYTDRGIVGITVDGDAETDLDCRLAAEPSVNTRRKLRTALAAGSHSVTIRLRSGECFYFDFLEAAVPGDVPDPFLTAANLSPALDYSTDHSFKLPPSRVLWIFDRLGYAGPMNEYIGVFWWNQRRRVGETIPSATVAFSGAYVPGDQVFVNLGGQMMGKSILQPGESPEMIAKHFQYFINSTLVGVWASVSGNVLTITNRSPAPAYSYSLDVTQTTMPQSTGTASVAGALSGGQEGVWEVDPAQTPALNAGARAWHADIFTGCHARNREIVVAGSMELVLPPAGFGAKFADGTVVETSVGFGTLVSTHCAFNSTMLDYQKQVFECIAGLMDSAGLQPQLQFGEFSWWYFTNHSANNPSGGMAYYDDETSAQARSVLGRPLHVFLGPDEDAVPNIADAVFLRDRLRDHVSVLGAHIRASYPSAAIEVLFPYDVNFPVPSGIHQLGGKLNRFVNFPAEWEKKPTSGFDRLKVEALDFGAWSRNLDLTLKAIRFPLELGWPRDSVRFLVPIFRSGYPWEKDVQRASGLGIPVVNLWAFDHVCIFNLLPLPPKSSARSGSYG